jgi:predicted Zn-dependent protease
MAQATIQFQKSDPTSAAATCEKILVSRPEFPPAQRLLAIIYSASNDPAKMSRAYEMAMKARDSYPADNAVAKAAAIIIFKKGDYERAARLLKDCASKPDADAEIYYYLGSAQFQLHDRKSSKSSLTQALSLKLSGSQADDAKNMLNQIK